MTVNDIQQITRNHNMNGLGKIINKSNNFRMDDTQVRDQFEDN